MANRPFEVVVWGATGTVGKLVCEHLVSSQRGKVHWAMAARNMGKLESVKAELCKIHPSAKELTLLTGDLQDKQSLRKLASQTKVMLATAGPYAKIGTPVVEACVEAKTHYCDLTGETTWIAEMIRDFHEQAAASSTKIVHCCGFDSIPSDLGTLFLVDHIRNKLGRPTRSVNTMWTTNLNGQTPTGTVNSLVDILEEPSDKVKKAADPYCLNPPGSQRGPDQGESLWARWDPVAGKYRTFFIMAPINTRIVRRSAALRGDSYGDGFSYGEHLAIPYGIVAYALTAVYGLGLAALQLGFIRNFIKRSFAGSTPDKAKLEKTGNWEADVWGTSQEAPGQPSQVVHARMEGINDPGLLDTARLITQAAICLAQQSKECDASGCLKGGVLTPASAMGMVLLKRLQDNGFTFEIVH